MPGQLNTISMIFFVEKGDFLNVQVKTHSKPDWGLASCADSLELAIQTEQILACANGEEVQTETSKRKLPAKLFPRNYELCPGKQSAGPAWN